MNEKQILFEILRTLVDMKQQEREYWETWKQNKQKEIDKQ